jgi:ABC-type cobalamin/Fe3+-siderophores transport system ATPase subunit
MGTRKPLAGKVLVQGVEAHTINSKWFNKHVGVVSAERLLSFLTFADQFDVGGAYSFESTAFESYASLVGFATHRQRADFWYLTPKRWKERKSFKALEMIQFLLARELYQQKPFLAVNARSFALSREEELALVHLLHYIRMTYNKTIIVAVTYITSLYYTDNVAYFLGGKVAEYGGTQMLLANETSILSKQYRQVQEKLAQEAQSMISSSAA